MTDVLRFVFLELGRFRKRIWELETVFDKWMYLLLHMHEMVEIPHIFQAPDFKRLFILSEIDNFTPEEYSEYQNSLTRMSDYYNIIDSAEKRAREEGREEARMEMALNLKRLGTPNDIIAQATGLAMDVIEGL